MGIPFAQPHEVYEAEGQNRYKQANSKEIFLNDVVAVVMMDDIPPELILNWNSFGSSLDVDNGQGGIQAS